MTRIYSTIPLAHAEKHPNSGIHQAVIHLTRGLGALGHQFVNQQADAELIISHAGNNGAIYPNDQKHITICHGLHPTANINPPERMLDQINHDVIQNIIQADGVVVPSEWVADILRRDMMLEPTVIHWGVHVSEWATGGENKGYVLWNKNRADAVCDPAHAVSVARMMPEQQFISTFGENPPKNMQVIGRQHHAVMQGLVKNAGVYLATTKETGDIGSREALAAGVPVVGYAQGALLDVVQHGVNGYLAQPNDVNGLARGIRYALVHRETLSTNAKHLARDYGWARPIEQINSLIRQVMEQTYAVDVSIVIPAYNYGHFVGDAIQSAALQSTTRRTEILVIDDGSTDNTEAVVRALTDIHESVRYVKKENGGVASARNHGLSLARGKYVVCLDADDMMESDLIETFANALDADRTLGIAYSRLRIMGGDVAGFPPLDFNFERHIRGQNQVPTCCMFRRDDALRVGGYRGYMTPAEDADFFLRLMSYTGKTAKCVSRQPLFVYRLHENSLSAPQRGNPEPDPFVKKWSGLDPNRRPIAAPPPPNRVSNPVRNYDQPFIWIQFTSEPSVALLDDLAVQTMPYWTLRESDNAPLRLMLSGNSRLPAGYLRDLILNTDLDNLPKEDVEGQLSMGCGCTKITKGVTVMNEGDFLLAEYTGAQGGYFSFMSPTRQKIEGRVIQYRVRKGAQVRVHKADIAAQPHLWSVVPSKPTLQVTKETQDPPAPKPVDASVTALPDDPAPPVMEQALYDLIKSHAGNSEEVKEAVRLAVGFGKDGVFNRNGFLILYDERRLLLSYQDDMRIEAYIDTVTGEVLDVKKTAFRGIKTAFKELIESV